MDDQLRQTLTTLQTTANLLASTASAQQAAQQISYGALQTLGITLNNSLTNCQASHQALMSGLTEHRTALMSGLAEHRAALMSGLAELHTRQQEEMESFRASQQIIVNSLYELHAKITGEVGRLDADNVAMRVEVSEVKSAAAGANGARQ